MTALRADGGAGRSFCTMRVLPNTFRSKPMPSQHTPIQQSRRYQRMRQCQASTIVSCANALFGIALCHASHALLVGVLVQTGPHAPCHCQGYLKLTTTRTHRVILRVTPGPFLTVHRQGRSRAVECATTVTATTAWRTTSAAASSLRSSTFHSTAPRPLAVWNARGHLTRRHQHRAPYLASRHQARASCVV